MLLPSDAEDPRKKLGVPAQPVTAFKDLQQQGLPRPPAPTPAPSAPAAPPMSNPAGPAAPVPAAPMPPPVSAPAKLPTAGPAGTPTAPAPMPPIGAGNPISQGGQTPGLGQTPGWELPPSAPPVSLSPTGQPISPVGPQGPQTPIPPVGGADKTPVSQTPPMLPAGDTSNNGTLPQYANQSLIEQMMKALLEKPSGYDDPTIQGEITKQSQGIDDEYALKQQYLRDELAQRGLGTTNDSSIGLGRLSDLNIGQRSAKADITSNILTEAAKSRSQDTMNALNMATNYGMGMTGLQLGQQNANFQNSMNLAQLLALMGWPNKSAAGAGTNTIPTTNNPPTGSSTGNAAGGGNNPTSPPIDDPTGGTNNPLSASRTPANYWQAWLGY